MSEQLSYVALNKYPTVESAALNRFTQHFSRLLKTIVDCQPHKKKSNGW